MTETEVLEAFRALGGSATAEQVLDKLGVKNLVSVLLVMRRLISRGVLQGGGYATTGGRYYHLVEAI